MSPRSLRILLVTLVVALSLATLMSTTALMTSFATADSMEDLVKAAQAEGELTTIALPHDWCGYGDLIEGFKKKYGLKVNSAQPDASSQDEITLPRRQSSAMSGRFSSYW